MLHKIALINENCQFLQRGIDLIDQIDDQLYSNNSSQYFMSGVGKHFRHVIDHYSSFLNGIETIVNYDERERNHLVETSRKYAVEVMKNIIDKLSSLNETENLSNQQLLVKSNEGEIDLSDASASHSSVRRELQFLISHTVHHYALIAIILRIQGFEPPLNFGIAPSTIAYLKTLQQSELSGK